MNFAHADERETTHIDQVAAALDGATVAVGGTASFVDVPVVVSADLSGRNEIELATISRPDPFDDTLRFHFTILPTAVSTKCGRLDFQPELMTYSWQFTVTESGGPSMKFQLIARCSDLLTTAVVGGTPSTEPVFILQRCDGDSVYEADRAPGRLDGCPADTLLSEADLVAGTVSDRVVQWDVPLSSMGASIGSLIESISMAVAYSVGPVQTGTLAAPISARRAYRVPGPSVRLGIAPAGVAVQDVTLTEDGTVQAGGAFSGQIPTPTEPGEYVVVVQACHGAGNCGLASTTITI